MNWLLIIPVFTTGFMTREWMRCLVSVFGKKKPLPERDVGDIVMDTRANNLPVVLLEKLTHGKFRACYITPGAAGFRRLCW